MSSFEIYLLWVVLPSIGYFFITIFFVVAAICFVYSIAICAHSDEWEDSTISSHWKRVKLFGIFAFICLFITCFIPDRKSIAVVYLAPKIINNQTIQQIPAEIMKFIDKEIEDKDSK